MPSRFNVSITILSCLRTRRSANLKNQSRLLSAMCLLTLARCRFARNQPLDRYCFRESALCAERIALRLCLSNCGDSIFVPSESVRNVGQPKSAPVSLPVSRRKPKAVYIPQTKAWGFDGTALRKVLLPYLLF